MNTIYNVLLKATLATLLALTMVACSSTDTDTDADGSLDLNTLQAETEFGTLHAQRVDDSFVSPLDEGQAVGIASLDDVGAEVDGLDDGIVVYLYDREDFSIMIGEVDEEGTVTLESEELSDFDSTAEIELEDGAVSGNVTIRDEAPAPFTANEATGVGGVYWATGSDGETDLRADWVVLPDERQWGCVCAPPAVAPCCHLGRF